MTIKSYWIDLLLLAIFVGAVIAQLPVLAITSLAVWVLKYFYDNI